MSLHEKDSKILIEILRAEPFQCQKTDGGISDNKLGPDFREVLRPYDELRKNLRQILRSFENRAPGLLLL